MKYKIGDVVQLKSGGPSMTIYETAPSGKHVNCQWFAGAKLERGHFPLETLQEPEPKKTATKKATS